MLYPIYTELTQCRDCYKCVRVCPVKAIQVKSGSAVVVKERCVYCGRCVEVCPSHAKKIRNDINRAEMLLKMNSNVFCSIAPSFAAEFPGREKAVLVAIQRLGFRHISETAIGATIVNACIERYRKEHDGHCPWISTACPSVVQLVKKYYPDDVKDLAPVPSPLQCQCAYLKSIYGKDTAIVFIGPCISKKVESDEYPGYPDIALTYKEFREWIKKADIDLDEIQKEIDEGLEVPRFEPRGAGASTLYPVEGGMISSLEWGRNPFQAEAYAISGIDHIKLTLREMSKEDNDSFLEFLSCEGGCINGPGSSKETSTARKKCVTSRFTAERLKSDGLFEAPDDFIDQMMAKGYGMLEDEAFVPDRATVVKRRKYTDEEILEAMHDLGKFNKEDELNCGGCGYDSCRDFAIAYLEGMAEAEMCVTKMRKEAQNKIDVLLRTIPMGVVIVDEQLNIVDCNSAFLTLFGDVDYPVDFEILNLMSGLPVERFVSFREYFRKHLYSSRPSEQYRLHHQDKFLRVTFFTVQKNHVVGAIFEDITSPTVRRETVVKKAEVVIQKSLETVQQIASLLGENAAETEIMLNSLIEAFKVPASDIDADELIEDR